MLKVILLIIFIMLFGIGLTVGSVATDSRLQPEILQLEHKIEQQQEVIDSFAGYIEETR